MSAQRADATHSSTCDYQAVVTTIRLTARKKTRARQLDSSPRRLPVDRIPEIEPQAVRSDLASRPWELDVTSRRLYGTRRYSSVRAVDAYERERATRRKRFGQNLRTLRSQKFGSQETFALEARINRVHVHYLETGKREPELATLLVLADALEVSLDRLTEGIVVPKHRRPGPPSRRR